MLCIVAALVPFAVAATTGAASEETSSAWWQWLIFPFVIVLFVPFVGAPQVAMLALIRLTKFRSLKLVFLGASTIMVGLLWWFFATADLSSTSTAAVAGFIYPIGLGAVSFALGLILSWVVKLAKGEPNRDDSPI
jgi:hypothetical protein